MNIYTKRAVIDYILKNGQLPVDQFGNLRPLDDIMVLYGLNDVLDPEEQRWIKRELVAIAEAQAVVDRLRARGV